MKIDAVLRLPSTSSQLQQNTSNSQYKDAGQDLESWAQIQHNVEVTEDVILSYLREKAATMDLNRIKWLFLMLKGRYPLVLLEPYYRFRKSMVKILTSEQCLRFITGAPDEPYLLYKVIAILSTAAKLTRTQIASLTATAIMDMGHFFDLHVRGRSETIQIKNTKTSPKYATIVRRYMARRPVSVTDSRLFVNDPNGSVTPELFSADPIGGTPLLIAKFLNLPNPNMYTFQAFETERATVPDQN